MTCLEVPIHLFGAYCILYKTPYSMNSVKLSMLNLHFWSSVLDLTVSSLTTPFILLPVIAGYPMGLLTYIGVPTAFQTYYVVILCASNYRVLVVLHFAMIEDRTVNSTFQTLPQLPSSVYSAPVFVLTSNVVYLVSTIVFMLFFILTEIVVIIILLHKRISMTTMSMFLSQNTISIQKKVLRNIYIQLFTPMSVLFFPLFYMLFLTVVEVYNQAMNNFCILFLAGHGLVSTIIMLWVHQPYRNAFFDVFRSSCSKDSQIINCTAKKNGDSNRTYFNNSRNRTY
uniref:Serpentine Receptor, class H n=1 Tax=Caenorhabditis japonica TaxID=281687 RepID=A0A8R1DYW7_CAEJA